MLYRYDTDTHTYVHTHTHTHTPTNTLFLYVWACVFLSFHASKSKITMTRSRATEARQMTEITSTSAQLSDNWWYLKVRNWNFFTKSFCNRILKLGTDGDDEKTQRENFFLTKHKLLLLRRRCGKIEIVKEKS